MDQVGPFDFFQGRVLVEEWEAFLAEDQLSGQFVASQAVLEVKKFLMPFQVPKMTVPSRIKLTYSERETSLCELERAWSFSPFNRICFNRHCFLSCDVGHPAQPVPHPTLLPSYEGAEHSQV